MKSTEQKIYGRNACLAFARKHPKAVIRAYCTEGTQGQFGFLLKNLAQQKRACHIVSATDLNKLAESEHHEGVILLVERPELKTAQDLVSTFEKSSEKKPECILCLDGIGNPHNLGSIVRSAAHFGIKRIVLMNTPAQNIKGLLSGAYHRTAEGGAVHVDVFHCESAQEFIGALAKMHGFTIAVTSSHSKSAALNKTKLPPRLALIMGSEAQGVCKELLSAAQLNICINGTGHVESLNVASATAILLNEYVRQTQRTTASRPSAKPTFVAGRTLGKNRIGS